MAPGDITKALQGVGGALVALGGLFAAVVALNDQFRQALEVLVTLPTWGWWAVAVALLLIGVWQLVIWRQKRSELLRPEALRLERDNPEHLVGRKDDIDALEQKCRGHGLVFLEGESGLGKSALVRAGLLPRLRADGRLLPLAVSIWGTEWERGPQRELADELWARLDTNYREKLKLASPPEPEALAQALGAMRGTIGLTPLLVCDQFDDYQARHRGKFLPGKSRSWLPARRLKETNAFWRAIAELCEQQSIHVLIVTRSDTAAGLESVRFQEPETHRLDRLQTAYVAPLFARLAGTGESAAIRAPERGWDRLRQRLARDLERDGFVLPQQLRSALAGLRSLRYLTIADYETAGGLAGLEATLVAREVKSAARTSGLTEAAVRRLLLAMVDDVAGWKTVARPMNELVAAAGDPMANETAVRLALDQLGSDRAELVRRRVDPDTRSEAWLLDHDYLTRGIVAAERNANRWRAMLEEGARALAEAGTLARRWRALLKPSEQVALLWARLRGRLTYGPYRAYAGKSVARLAPFIAWVAFMLGVGAALVEWQARERAADEANAILQRLLLAGDGLAHNEMDALWSLASTDDERVRNSFTQQLLHSTTFAERFNRNREPVVRALAGLDPTRAQRLGQVAVGGNGEGDPLPRQVAALNLELLVAPKSVDIGRAVPVLTSALAGGRDVRTVLGRLVGTVDRNQAQAALDPVLAAMQGTTDPDALWALAQAVQALPTKLTDVQAQAALDPVLAAMQGTTDPFAFRALAQAYQALAGKLDARAGAALAGIEVGLARSGTGDMAKSFLEAADAVTASDSFDQFVPLAFSLLKYPTVTGEAEAYLLQRLRERAGGTAEETVDLWSAVGWAERTGGIDLNSPPQRPTLADAVMPAS